MACNDFYRLSRRETCKTVMSQKFSHDPVLFYAYNPGIDCDSMDDPGAGSFSSFGADGEQVCAVHAFGMPLHLCTCRVSMLRESVRFMQKYDPILLLYLLQLQTQQAPVSANAEL
jgi:hypothetical protein